MRTAKILIRLEGCPGWSETSLGTHAILLILSPGGSNLFQFSFLQYLNKENLCHFFLNTVCPKHCTEVYHICRSNSSWGKCSTQRILHDCSGITEFIERVGGKDKVRGFVPGQASKAVYQYLVHILSPVTDNCPSWISGRERMAVEIISRPIPMKEYSLKLSKCRVKKRVSLPHL